MNTRILYIDNDEASYFLVSELLEGCNVEIQHARCGLCAIRLLKTYTDIDIVITELKLPIIDGFGVLNEVKKINSTIPVIAQTANVVNNMKYDCLNSGFNEFISKPIDLREFLAIVKKYSKTEFVIP